MSNLANRIVALGVGTMYGSEIFYSLESSEYVQGWEADQFTHSWEVAGALMEKVVTETDRDVIAMWDDGKYLCAVDRYDDMAIEQSTESLPYAINLACVEALEAQK